MEPSTFFIDQEIKFKKADLEALEEGKHTKSPWNHVCNLSNFKYCISLYPNRGHQKSWIFLNLYLGRAANVDADANISIQNSNFSANIKRFYKVNKCWGKVICATSELFADENTCFTDGELIVKIKGSFKIEFHRLKYPFSVQWKITESDLKELKNDCLYSKNLTASDSDVKCYISFYPNGDGDEENQGETWISLYLKHGSNSKTEAVWKFLIDSVNLVEEDEHVFEGDHGWGFRLCSTEELFNPENGYFVDGKLTLKVSGTLMIEKEKEPTILTLEKGIVQKGYHRGKNFTFIIGEKSIKLHKHVLKLASPVFAGMFESNLKEVKEKKMEIIDFEYEIVHAAMKLLYSTPLPQTFTFDQMLDLLQFSDKYEIDLIKNAIQDYLIQRISPTNVCHLITAATTFINAPKLLSNCKEYLIRRMKKKRAVHDLDILEKNVLIEMFMIISTKNV